VLKKIILDDPELHKQICMSSVVEPLSPKTLSFLPQTNKALIQESLQIRANSTIGGIQVVLDFQNPRNLKTK